MQEMAANPLKAAVLVVRKCGRFWFLGAKRREQAVSIVIQALYLAMAAFGLWRVRPWNGEVVMIVTLIGYVMLIHALSYADLRFSLPVMPLICVFAGYSACSTGASRSAA
jgi:predicted MarR family transcription regulator